MRRELCVSGKRAAHGDGARSDVFVWGSMSFLFGGKQKTPADLMKVSP